MSDLSTSSSPRPDRWLLAPGGHNIRDLGGLRAQDGRRVKRGQVFRSGTMAHLDADGAAMLRASGLKVICDLRGNDERALEPTGWEALGCDYWRRDHNDSSGDLARLAVQGDCPDAGFLRQGMIDLYARIAFSQEESFRAIFGYLLAGRTPLLFHCAAGKDRTGAMSALLLLALGVEREEIMRDFLLSNERSAQQKALFVDHPNDMLRRLAALPDALSQPMLQVEAAYLDAMIAALEARSGTLDAYFATAFGLGAAERERLQDALLE